MEHVAFLIEQSGETVRCLLNPESMVIRRSAGVRTRQPTGGRAGGAGPTDDLVFFTGGGRTELELDLLFDIDLRDAQPEGSSLRDVRELTRRIADLAENSAQSEGIVRPPQVRFLWGKAWNIPAVVLAVAERYENFTSAGNPRRSWLRIRLLRVSDRLAKPAPRRGQRSSPGWWKPSPPVHRAKPWRRTSSSTWAAPVQCHRPQGRPRR